MGILRAHIGFVALLAVYLVVELLMIGWGIPGEGRMYTYHMDEWHQMMAVRNLKEYGSPNVAGSANGPILHFLVSGIYLVPFVVTGLLDPGAIGGAASGLAEQTKLFLILRLNTLIWGVGTVVVMYATLRLVSRKFATPLLCLLVLSPIWISLSNYFKYDIALVFWMSVSVLISVWAIDNRGERIWMAGLAAGLSAATKITALPLMIVVDGLAVYLWRSGKITRNVVVLTVLAGLGAFVTLGLPDLFLGTGDYSEYLYSNAITAPAETEQMIFPNGFWYYQLVESWPRQLGVGIYGLAIITFVWIVIGRTHLDKLGQTEKTIFGFLCVGFLVFLATLVPLGIAANRNRLLVLMPWLVPLLAVGLGQIESGVSVAWKQKLWSLVGVALVFQTIQTQPFIEYKLKPNVREIASEWVVANIESGTKIGVEAPAIYEHLPEVVLMSRYGSDLQQSYQVVEISTESEVLPETVVLTNTHLARVYRESRKEKFMKRLRAEGYEEIVAFHAFERENMWLAPEVIPNPALYLMPNPREIEVWQK